MSDPFSIVAGVVGITGVALHGTRVLLDDLQQLKDAPETITCLTEDIRSVDATLKLFQNLEDKEWELLGAGVAEQSKATISSCTKACEIFRIDLQRWTKNSVDGEMARRDRAKVGLFKRGQIKAMTSQLANCKLSINSVVCTATLLSSARHSNTTEDIKKMVASTQAEIKGALTTTDKQLAALENRLDDLDLDPSSDEDKAAASSEGKTEALRRQLEEGLRSVQASQELLNELLSKSQEEAVLKLMKNQYPSSMGVFGNNNSGFQAVTINGGVSGLTFGKR